MSLLIETIKVIDGQLQNLHYHNNRLNRSRSELFSGTSTIDIAKVVKVPIEASKGIYRCTVIYSEAIVEIKFVQYSIKSITNLKLVFDNQIEYAYKYADRSKLYELLEQKGDCDEILVIKNGMVTDTSYTNIVFYNGINWLTPSTPLLKGTKRQKLLDEKKIIEAEISMSDIKKFEKASLINAMLDVEDIVIDCANIR